jgi:hypothetical protein
MRGGEARREKGGRREEGGRKEEAYLKCSAIPINKIETLLVLYC